MLPSASSLGHGPLATYMRVDCRTVLEARAVEAKRKMRTRVCGGLRLSRANANRCRKIIPGMSRAESQDGTVRRTSHCAHGLPRGPLLAIHCLPLPIIYPRSLVTGSSFQVAPMLLLHGSWRERIVAGSGTSASTFKSGGSFSAATRREARSHSCRSGRSSRAIFQMRPAGCRRVPHCEMIRCVLSPGMSALVRRVRPFVANYICMWSDR